MHFHFSIQVYKRVHYIALKTLPTDLNGNFGTVRVWSRFEFCHKEAK